MKRPIPPSAIPVPVFTILPNRATARRPPLTFPEDQEWAALWVVVSLWPLLESVLLDWVGVD